MRWVFILLATLLPNTSLGSPIGEHIKRVSPRTPTHLAMRYARVILKESNRYGINPNIVVAIIAQESMFQVVSTRRQVIDRQEGLVHEYFDLGLMQVNIGTARGYGFDIDRLIVDDEYQIRAGIQVLADKIKTCETLYPENPWGCYHSTTFKYHSAYVTNVRRWL